MPTGARFLLEDQAMAATTSPVYAALAAAIELGHALSMVVWGLGLPLLVWHRYARLSRAYMWYAIVFVTVSVISNWILGECFLTTLARHAWQAAGGFRESVPFTVLLANAVAGIRPSAREAVLAWQAAVVLTSIGTLWCWRKTRSPAKGNGELGSRRTPRKRYAHPAWLRNAPGR